VHKNNLLIYCHKLKTYQWKKNNGNDYSSQWMLYITKKDKKLQQKHIQLDHLKVVSIVEIIIYYYSY